MKNILAGQFLITPLFSAIQNGADDIKDADFIPVSLGLGIGQCSNTNMKNVVMENYGIFWMLVFITLK